MKITQLEITPVRDVQWLSVTDTVQDAFDHMETFEVTAVPLLDWAGRYVGTLTFADLRRHVDTIGGRGLASPLGEVPRRAHYPAVSIDDDVERVERFVPVIDDTGKLVGIVPPQQRAA
jgi:CBS domain-containing protein